MVAPISPEYIAQSNVNIVLLPSVVFLAVAPIVVGIRLWARFMTSARVGADDVTIFVSMVSKKTRL